MDNLLKLKTKTLHLELNYHDLYSLDPENFKNILSFSNVLFRNLTDKKNLTSFINYFDYSLIDQNNSFTVDELKSKNINLFIELNENVDTLFIKKFEDLIIDTLLFLNQTYTQIIYDTSEFDPFSISASREANEEFIQSSILTKFEIFDIEYNMKKNEKKLKLKI